MLRVLVVALPHWRDDWRPAIWVLAVLTLVIGSVLAVVQTDVKRMLAYSSISHAGFILVGVEAAAHRAGEADTGYGVPAALLYLLALRGAGRSARSPSSALVGRTGDGGHRHLDAFRGLGTQQAGAGARHDRAAARPGRRAAHVRASSPSSACIEAAVEEESYAIAIIAMVAAVIAAFLYLRIMVSMWIAEPEAGDDDREPVRVPFSTGLAIVLAVGFTLAVGFFPGWLIDASREATTIVLGSGL